MEILLILLIGFVLALFIAGYWIYRIIKLFQKKQTFKAIINLIILFILIFTIGWEMRIIPLAITNDFNNKTENLTGKKFWSWNKFRYDEIGARGEGFTFEIYKLSPEIAKYFQHPPPEFFTQYPTDLFETEKWRKTPIHKSEYDLLEFVTPAYGNWSARLKREIAIQQDMVRQLSKEPGSYYVFGNNNSRDFFLINPAGKIIVYINHNM